MLKMNDPSTQLRKRLEKKLPTQGALTEKEFQKLIEKTMVKEPTQVKFTQSGVKASELLGDGETYKRQIALKIAPKLSAEQLQALIRVKESKEKPSEEDMAILNQINAIEYSVTTGNPSSVYLASVDASQKFDYYSSDLDFVKRLEPDALPDQILQLRKELKELKNVDTNTSSSSAEQ